MSTNSSSRAEPGARGAIGSRLRAQWWVAGVVLTALVVLMIPFRPLPRLSSAAYDFFTRWDPAMMRGDIVLVQVDNASVERVGPWPWPRERQAALVSAIGKGRPAAIAVNIVLAERDDIEGDLRLADAVRRTGVPTYLGVAVENRMEGTDPGGASVLRPSPVLASAATALGHTSLPVDNDGLVRRFHPRLAAEDQSWPDLMCLMAQTEGARASGPQHEGGGQLIPFASRGRLLRIPAWRLLSDPAAASLLAGRRVIVGVTATGIATMFPTALASRDGYVSGSEIEAHLLSGLLDGRARREAGTSALIVFSILPVWLLLLLVRHTGPGRAMLCTPVLIVAVVTLDWVLLVRAGIWFPLGPCLVGLFLVHPLWSWRRMSAVMAFMDGELAGLRTGQAAHARPGVRDPMIEQADLLSQAIAEARESRRFVEDVVHRLPAPAVVLNPAGAVIFGNSAAERLFARLGLERLSQSDITALLSCFLADKESNLQPNTDGIAGMDAQAGPVGLRSRDGGSFELAVGALHGRGGTIRAWIFQFTETTQTRAAVRQREEVMQLLTHDIRSPLVSILASLEQAGEFARSLAGVRIEKYARRALTLADEFVLLARARGQVYHREALCLHHLVEEAVEEVRPQAEAAGIALLLEGEEEPWLVEGDSSLLQRAVVNLLCNAIKYGASGGRVACRVDNVASSDGPNVVVVVRDWGEGMAEQAAPHIFERFRQGRAHGARSGAGLGLAFVDTVMRGHGGTVTCRSSPGAGSVFLLRMPAMAAQDQPGADQAGEETLLMVAGATHAND